MADTLETNNQDHDIVVEVKDEYLASNKSNNSSGSMVPTEFLQQVILYRFLSSSTNINSIQGDIQLDYCIYYLNLVY